MARYRLAGQRERVDHITAAIAGGVAIELFGVAAGGWHAQPIAGPRHWGEVAEHHHKVIGPAAPTDEGENALLPVVAINPLKPLAVTIDGVEGWLVPQQLIEVSHNAGHTPVVVPLQQVPLEAAMNLLHERGIKSLMVEGGAKVITAFLKAGLADALILTVAPRLVGGYKAVGDLQDDLQVEGCDRQLSIHPLYCAPAGRDTIVWGDLQYDRSEQ